MKKGKTIGNGNAPVLITGGAGFIGTNLADRLLSLGRRVIIFDNLSRPGVEKNLRWLRKSHSKTLEFIQGDVRNKAQLQEAAKDAGEVFHFAAQVAVTTSLVDPELDFEVNLRGTLNLLEVLREREHPPFLLFTSTNKVYGNLSDIELRKNGSRYEPEDEHIRMYGVGESRPLDFHSPYGCSKGAADQYILDYARIFGIPATVFRMSCIYGTHQCGTEDQGWVAHFLLRALDGRGLTIYGDGKQVRDILFVEDLVDAFLAARANMSRVQGRVFNIGGSAGNTVSLVELLDIIEGIQGSKVPTEFSEWRQGDQRYYVSDIREFQHVTGWKPKIPVQDGVARLYHWLAERNFNTQKTSERNVVG